MSAALACFSWKVRVCIASVVASASNERTISTTAGTSPRGPRTRTLLELVSGMTVTVSSSSPPPRLPHRERRELCPDNVALTASASDEASALVSRTISTAGVAPESAASNCSMSVSASVISFFGALTTIALAAATAEMVICACDEPRLRRPQRERVCCWPVTTSCRTGTRSDALACCSRNVRVVMVIPPASASISLTIVTTSPTRAPGPRTSTLLELVSAMTTTLSPSPPDEPPRRRRDRPVLWPEMVALTDSASDSAWACCRRTSWTFALAPDSSESNSLMSASASESSAGGALTTIALAPLTWEMRMSFLPEDAPPRRPQRERDVD